jgi:Mg-chelatase subunit ChlD
MADRGHLASALTEEDGTGVDHGGDPNPVDAAVLASVREIAAQLRLRPPAYYRRVRAPTGRRTPRPYRHQSDELDLDRTIEVLLDDPHPSSEDLVVREAEVTRREVVLVVDASGSMRGERARIAAAAVGALAGQLDEGELALIAFWSDAALLKPMSEPRRALDLVGDLLRIRASGLTNIAFPLQAARNELSADPGRERRVILLSDCVHNAGPDPRDVAASLPRLDVLFDSGGESDGEMAHDLARRGRGQLHEVISTRQIAQALTALFEE